MKKNSAFFLMIFLLVEMLHAMDHNQKYNEALLEEVDSWLCLDDVEEEVLKPSYDFAQVAIGVQAVRSLNLQEGPQESLSSEKAKPIKKRKVKRGRKKQDNKRLKQENQYTFNHYTYLKSADDLKLEGKKTNKFECLKCNEWFPLTKKDKHRAYHERENNVCEDCKFSFVTRRSFQSHRLSALCSKKQQELREKNRAMTGQLDSVVQKKKEFFCSNGCGYKTFLSCNLEVHERDDHTKEHTCKYCLNGRIFMSHGALVQHVTQDHQVSDVCSYSFCGLYTKDKRMMRLHQQPHVHEGSYVCEFCSTFFSSAAGCNQHRKKCRKLKNQ